MKIEGTVSFIGAGNMGEAMIKGLIKSGLAAKNIKAMDVFKDRIQYIIKTYKVKKAANLADALAADAVVIAVKPKDVDGVINFLSEAKVPLPLIVTIAAGVSVARFVDKLGPKARVVRVMPNTPALVGEAVSAYYAGTGVRGKDLALAEAVIKSMGACHQLTDETLIDAVTGLSGSGPAYVFVMIDAMADAGVKMGLSRPLALALAAQTVKGAAAMVIETGEHPMVLKDKVTSPAGTTIEGLAELERGGFRAAIINAIEAAAWRSEEMGNK